ncbi:MAG: 16S rRNA (uracil(1498)-N(3))-methyltransferase [Chthoniobacteraceae bacterium]
MGAPRFYIEPASWNLDRLALDADDAHHCLDVLRMKAGERATVFDGRGHEATVEISTTAKDRVELRVLQHAKTPPIGAQIVLGQAVPKGKNMDLIIEKVTELGAAEIVPLLSERTVVRLDAADAKDKRGKWQRVAIEACKQCGQNWLPEVAAPLTPKAFFDSRPKFDLMLIASLQPDARHLKDVLAEITGGGVLAKTKRPRRVLVLVGPEGDFTPAEISLARSAGCQPITLGPVILRTETAAIYCVSVLSHELHAP